MKVCTYNEFEYCKVFGYYFDVCEYYYVNLNHVWIWIVFKFEIFKYSCNLYLSNGIGWLKLADTKDSLPHPEQRIFGVCVMTADTKDRSTAVYITNGLFFVSHKGYRIHWSAPKTGYQLTLKIIFVVVTSS
jgi:hypothetical protein